MRPTAFAFALTLALAACALPEERLHELRAEAEESEARLTALAHEPLAEFLAEPHGSCDSRNLWFAEYLTDVAGDSEDFSLISMGAGLKLDVADAAAAHGCPEVARAIYQEVIQRYIGLAYTAHRQRAEIGLAELRAQDE